MKTIYSILVIIEPKHDNNSVLTRAKEFAKVMGGSLHLIVCKESKTSKDIELLNNLINTLHEQGFNATSEIAWGRSYHQTIVTIQKAQNSAIVIKSHLPDSALKRVLLTPEDWKLLRTCPCPILIVNDNHSWADRPVLAAVDLGNPEKNHIILHNTLVKIANILTKITKGSLHLVSVYPSPIFSEIHPDSHVPGMTPEIREIYTTACETYEKQYAALTKENIHLSAGAADIIIPQVAKDIDAAVCVIGTVARTGLSGVLIGNTAEAILDDLTCDILVIKPESINTQLEQLSEYMEDK